MNLLLNENALNSSHPIEGVVAVIFLANPLPSPAQLIHRTLQLQSPEDSQFPPFRVRKPAPVGI